MTPTEKFYNYLSEKYDFTEREKNIIHDVISFVFEKDNWGISFKTHIILKMLKSLELTETEIIHYLIDDNI